MSIFTRVVDHLAAVVDSTDDRRGRPEPGLAYFAGRWNGYRAAHGLDPLPAEPIVAEWDKIGDHARAEWARKEAASGSLKE